MTTLQPMTHLWKRSFKSSFLYPLIVGLALVMVSIIACGGGTSSGGQTAVVPGVGQSVPLTDTRHVRDGTRVSYSTTPPTSGSHWDKWMPCGSYDEEIPDERVVHNMEHGHVVISYNLSEPAGAERMRQLASDLPDLNEWGVVRPYAQIPDGTVAMTAWGIIDQVKGVDEDGIRRFYETYINNQLSGETRQLGPRHSLLAQSDIPSHESTVVA